MKKWMKIAEILSVLCIITSILLWGAYKFGGLELSDTIIRVMGITNLIAIPLYTFTQVKRNLNK